MKTIEIVIFIKHLEKERKNLHSFSSLAKAQKFCQEFSSDNPEYGLKKNPKNSRHWTGDSYNFSLRIEKVKLD